MLPQLDEEFLMEFPLPPHLIEAYNKDSLIVEAIYRGTIGDEESEILKEEGSLKEMYNRLDLSEHHIVEFGGDLWINDLLDINPETISMTPII